MRSINKKSLPLIIVLSLATWLWNEYGAERLAAGSISSTAKSSDSRLETAFKNRESNLQIAGAGTVIHVLRDDTNGSRHQRFLMELDSGLTLLVAHNIDLAPRIPQLEKGDTVAFFGEYEWTEKGGVIHWTHHDPGGRHEDGWLEHHGKRYQ
ncbi:DUF3465 domain-containing protein [Congregibacter variabilis]|uniref:DUF3465 domain-containing protein n=1 Tax=Congregibacter variabilis TaxID=3081200 RepID=A0ABZ0HXE5_9GAMM|nr:DUF3465 domain-containing protein [Congregibacter sp. IMCC43200]